MNYNYLIVTESHEPFYTNWFDAENNFNKDDKMIVFDFRGRTHRYTTNGKDWYDIPEDHL